MDLQNKIVQNKIELFNSFNSLSLEQVNYKSNEKTWSILQCLEHIFLVDVGISKVLTMNATEQNNQKRQNELYGEEKINYLLLNRSYKVTAPDFVNPKGRFKSTEDAQQNINIILEKVVHHISTNDITSETLTVKHDFLGEMTKTDWFYFLIHHTSRHVLQIEEVKKIIADL